MDVISFEITWKQQNFFFRLDGSTKSNQASSEIRLLSV